LLQLPAFELIDLDKMDANLMAGYRQLVTLHEAIAGYISNHKPDESFLRSLIENDQPISNLMIATTRYADDWRRTKGLQQTVDIRFLLQARSENLAAEIHRFEEWLTKCNQRIADQKRELQ